MARRTRKIDVDYLQARRYESVPRLLNSSALFCREILLRKLAARGHKRLGLSHAVVFRNMDPEGSRLSDITKRANVSRQAVAKVAGQLARLGYVKMVPDRQDRRVKVLKLTAKGFNFFADAIEVYDEVEREFAAQIGRRELEQLRTLLRKLSDANVGPGR